MFNELLFNIIITSSLFDLLESLTKVSSKIIYVNQVLFYSTQVSTVVKYNYINIYC